jgi:hypothetical protein
VFAFVSDVRNRPQWDDSVDSEELTSPEPIRVGTTVRTRLRSMGREYQYTWEIVEYVPPASMKVESTSGPFPTTLAWQFAGQDGRTGPGLGHGPSERIDAPPPTVDRPHHTTEPRRGYERLKHLLETGTPYTPSHAPCTNAPHRVRPAR